MKSNCSQALEQCINDIHELLVFIKVAPEFEQCSKLAHRCKDACVECLDACESARLDRGKMMLACVEVCGDFAAECRKYEAREFRNCAASCRACIEEFENVLA
ncbi:hypothetical protein LZF95_11275 [Algoriphagus sp. AGSA1]|uniref:hypothetical protein n=1 Tax=Algoriphagus sp. AGSA1 TaxID=2907213 RepID=UPI001F3E7CAD|nr:hypothetical protein [Algoriphagus sp. AGSA1]MCE7055257.1 hypothetical protein [Algoriphagus sp. AGSA1]